MNTQVSVVDVAKYILRELRQTSAMKLEKLVYYCQAWSLVWDELKKQSPSYVGETFSLSNYREWLTWEPRAKQVVVWNIRRFDARYISSRHKPEIVIIGPSRLLVYVAGVHTAHAKAASRQMKAAYAAKHIHVSI